MERLYRTPFKTEQNLEKNMTRPWDAPKTQQARVLPTELAGNSVELV